MWTSGHCGSTNRCLFGKEVLDLVEGGCQVIQCLQSSHPVALKADLWPRRSILFGRCSLRDVAPALSTDIIMKRRTSFSWDWWLSMETPSVCSNGSGQMCGSQCSFMVTYCEWTAPLQIFSSALITPTDPSALCAAWHHLWLPLSYWRIHAWGGKETV